MARKALTVDALRERVKKTMAKPHERACTNCSGSGRVSGPLTAADVIDGAGITQSAFYGFTKKGKSLSLEAGLKLLAWLDRLEDPLSELDDPDEPNTDEEPRAPSVREASRDRLAAIRNQAAAAAASAGIDAMNRPLQTGTGR